jgi:cell division protein FtsZ
MRTPRMPRVDELPLPAQNEIKAQRGELAENHPEKQRMSLMQRLASVGLGRRTDEAEPPPAPRTARAMPQFERPPSRRFHPSRSVRQCPGVPARYPDMHS